MEIYIRVHSDDNGTIAWWNHNKDSGESYLMYGKDLWCFDSPYYDYCRGTAFHSVKEAKHEAREAVLLAGHDGVVDPKATFWHCVGGKLVQLKFTRDGKIKK